MFLWRNAIPATRKPLRMRVLASAWLLLAGAAVQCAEPPADIQVQEAWIRWLPADVPAAGYMTLTNHGTSAEVLLGASSPAYGEITLHQSRRTGQMSGMVRVESLELAPGMSVNFALDGYHWMLGKPRHPPQRGDMVPITLRFSRGRSMTVSFAVREPNASISGCRWPGMNAVSAGAVS